MEPRDQELLKEPSILRCTVKKSWHVGSKVILYASYVIVTITVLAAGWFGANGIWEAIKNPLAALWQTVTGAVASIPWYAYVAVAGVLTIPAYSFLWCVSRDLTEADWKSDAAKLAAIALALALATLATLAPADNPSSMWYYVGRFCGAAWHHYRKRA